MSNAEFVNAVSVGDRVVAYRRLPDGKLVETSFPAEYSYFIKTSDFTPEIERQVRKSSGTRAIRVEGDYVRVICIGGQYRYGLCAGKRGVPGWFEQRGIPTFEADLHPVRRWLIDKQPRIQRPRAALFDIETDSRIPFNRKEEMRILCWSMIVNGELVSAVLEKDTDRAEITLLEDFWFELEQADQVLAWNGDRFDFPLLLERSCRYGIVSDPKTRRPGKIDPRRWLWLDHMLAFKKYNMHSTQSGEEKDSAALERVAESLGLATGAKTAVDASQSWELWEAGGESRAALSRRCDADVTLMQQVEQKTGYIDLHYSVAATCGVFPDTRAIRALVQVEGFVMRLAAERNIRFPSVWGQDKEARRSKFRGAVVFPVKRGIKRDVHVCDFSGMYPANIESWNMSPETIRPELAGKPGETLADVVARVPGCAVAPHTLQVFQQEPVGILPIAVSTLKQLRNGFKKAKAVAEPNTPAWFDADRGDQGAKIVANSCFGVACSPFSRINKREVGESITLTGKWLIEETVAHGQSTRGFGVLAGDTDSLFVDGVSEAVFRDFKNECNRDLYPRLLKSAGCIRNVVELDYEKEFSLLIQAAKKRYAGRLKHFKGKPATKDAKPVIKGFEYKRGDATRLTRRFQEEVIRKLLLIGEEVPREYPLKPDDFVEIIERWKVATLEGELTKRDVVISQSLRKDVEEYDRGNKKDGTPKAMATHAEVAKILQGRGEDVSDGTRIEYVVIDGDASPVKVIPACDYTPGCEDRAYLWEVKVWRPTRRVLESCWPDYNWARFDEGKDRGGGRGRSRYAPGQNHFPWF